MTAMAARTLPLGWLVEDLAFLPLWVRPWTAFLLVLAAAWFLFFRSGLKLLLVWALRLLVLTGVVVLTVPLALEYVDTRRRRAMGKLPGRVGGGTSQVAEAVSLNLAGLDRRLGDCRYRSRKWPLKTMVTLVVAGLVSWIALGVSPALAAPAKFPGNAYVLWLDFEHWAGGSPAQTILPTGEAAPLLMLSKGAVVLSTSPAHAGQLARLDPTVRSGPHAQVTLDKRGNGVIRLTRSAAATFVRGRTYLVQTQDLRILLRLQ